MRYFTYIVKILERALWEAKLLVTTTRFSVVGVFVIDYTALCYFILILLYLLVTVQTLGIFLFNVFGSNFHCFMWLLIYTLSMLIYLKE